MANFISVTLLSTGEKITINCQYIIGFCTIDNVTHVHINGDYPQSQKFATSVTKEYQKIITVKESMEEMNNLVNEKGTMIL